MSLKSERVEFKKKKTVLLRICKKINDFKIGVQGPDSKIIIQTHFFGNGRQRIKNYTIQCTGILAHLTYINKTLPWQNFVIK